MIPVLQPHPRPPTWQRLIRPKIWTPERERKTWTGKPGRMPRPPSYLFFSTGLLLGFLSFRSLLDSNFAAEPFGTFVSGKYRHDVSAQVAAGESALTCETQEETLQKTIKCWWNSFTREEPFTANMKFIHICFNEKNKTGQRNVSIFYLNKEDLKNLNANMN